MIKSILIGFLSPQRIFSTFVVFLRNVYFCPFSRLCKSQWILNVCAHKISTTLPALKQLRELLFEPVQEPAHRSVQGALTRPAHNQIISGLLCTEPPVPRARTNTVPYCAHAATWRHHAEPLPVRLVNTTLELSILLLE